MLMAWISLIVFFAGLVIYFIASKAETKETGRAMLWCGLLITLASLMKHTISIP